MNRFFKAVTYPFRKINEATSKLVDKISPSKQEKIVRAKPFVWCGMVVVVVPSLLLAPYAVASGLIFAYGFYGLTASYCEEKVQARIKVSQTPPAPPTDIVDNSTSPLQTSSPASDFKAAAEHDVSKVSSAKPAEPQPPKPA